MKLLIAVCDLVLLTLRLTVLNIAWGWFITPMFGLAAPGVITLYVLVIMARLAFVEVPSAEDLWPVWQEKTAKIEDPELRASLTEGVESHEDLVWTRLVGVTIIYLTAWGLLYLASIFV